MQLLYGIEFLCSKSIQFSIFKHFNLTFIMAEKKQYMPQSTAGIMRYMDVEERLQIRPTHVVALRLIFGAVVLVLKFFS